MHAVSFAHRTEAFFETSMRNTQNKAERTEYIWGWCEDHQKWCVMLVRFRDGAEPLEKPEKVEQHLQVTPAKTVEFRKAPATDALREVQRKFVNGEQLSAGDFQKLIGALGLRA